MEFRFWPVLIPGIQLALLQSPCEHLGGLASITVMTGLPPTSMLQFCALVEVEEWLTVLQIKETQLENIHKLAQLIDDCHELLLKHMEK